MYLYYVDWINTLKELDLSQTDAGSDLVQNQLELETKPTLEQIYLFFM